MDEDDNYPDFPAASFEEIVAEIETHDAFELVMFDRSPSSGYVTIMFYERSGESAGKLTFDEPEEDMVFRAKAVLDFLSTTTGSVEYMVDVQSVWDSAEMSFNPN